MSTGRLSEVRQALARRALDRRGQFGATMAWFCMERLVCRMSGHGHRDKLLLSGDLLLFAVCGGEAPYEWEAELRCPPEEFREVAGTMAAVCEVTLDDGLVFELTAKNESSAEVIALSVVARLGPNPCSLTILVRPEVPFAGALVDLPFASSLDGLSASRPLGQGSGSITFLNGVARGATTVGSAGSPGATFFDGDESLQKADGHSPTWSV